MGHATLPPDGLPPRPRCARYIEAAGRQCRARAEAGDLWCRFHGGKAPSHEGKKQERITDYQDQLMELADNALDTIQEKLQSPNHAVALRAALEILDRAGVVTTKKSETTTTIMQKSELDAKIEELLGQAPSTEPQGEDQAVMAENGRPLPATSFSSQSASGDPSSHTPSDEFGVAGGGAGLGLGGSGVSGNENDEGEDVP